LLRVEQVVLLVAETQAAVVVVVQADTALA
jgi:hypothetical protein